MSAPTTKKTPEHNALKENYKEAVARKAESDARQQSLIGALNFELSRFESLPLAALVSLKLARTIWGVSKSTLYEGIKSGRYPPPIHAGPRARKYTKATVLEVLKNVEEASAQ